jgi:hypothetical protein
MCFYLFPIPYIGFIYQHFYIQRHQSTTISFGNLIFRRFIYFDRIYFQNPILGKYFTIDANRKIDYVDRRLDVHAKSNE